MSFVARFRHQTERGAALSAVAQLDNALLKGVRKWLADDDPEVANSMFREMQPLGTFGARIRMGYLLGMYSKTIFDNLMIVNRIRNDFAHVHEARDFDYPQALSRTNALTIIEIMQNVRSTGGRALDLKALMAGLGDGGWSQPYWKFTVSVFLLAAVIVMAGADAPERKPPVI